MITSVEEGFAWFESFTNLEKGRHVPREYRLGRMHALLAAFDHPHLELNAIHVAGSKGKGSTAAFLQSVLTEAGYRVGGYYSPHVTSYRERFLVTPVTPDDQQILRLMRWIERHVHRMLAADPTNEPTTFELLTLLGFLLFRELELDWVVLETGLGGRLDATNVVTPRASVITPIELEHTEYLGDTIAKIAAEKAGIIKPGVPAFSALQRPEALSQIAARADQVAAPLWRFDAEVQIAASAIAEFTLRRTGERFTVQLRLPGAHQARNAALAAGVIRALLPQLPCQTIARGLEHAWIPGRLERLGGEPPCYLDGAHTPESVAAVAEAFTALAGTPREGTARVLIFGAAAGKDVAGMADRLAPHFDQVVVTTAGSFKPGDPSLALDAFCRIGVPCRLVPDAAAALQSARELAGAGGAILVTGSFYTVGAIRAARGGQPSQPAV